MRGSEISAVGVWGVSMSMRVRHGLRARGALVSTPLFEIQAAYRRPMGRSKNARSRSNGKLYLFARKPDHHWHRLGMGRLSPETPHVPLAGQRSTRMSILTQRRHGGITSLGRRQVGASLRRSQRSQEVHASFSESSDCAKSHTGGFWGAVHPL